MIKKQDKNEARVVRHIRVRKTLSGTADKPRLTVYRSLNEIYAQIIDDVKGVTLVSASTKEKAIASDLEGKNKTEQARVIGELISKRAIEKGVNTIVFDRSGYVYTGRIAALADAARNAGLKF